MIEQRCSLCGDEYHLSPDTEGWMGSICPGDLASDEAKEAFLNTLTKAYAEHIANEFYVLYDKIDERRRLWYDRTRSEVTHEALQADCDERTGVELARQRREEIFQEYGEIDLPGHIVVKGRVPDPPLIQASQNNSEPEDSLLFVDPSQDVS